MKSKLLFVINFIVIILLLGYYGLFLAKKVDLTTADLGRHIKNGKIIVNSIWHPHPTSPLKGEEGEQRGTGLYSLLTTNYYSYTMPNEPFVNHHWLSGVVFYLIYLVGGFVGLSWFYILLGCATLWLFFDVARKKSNLFIASVITIALMPLLASRTEVRPEVITYFFTGVFLWCLSDHEYTNITNGTNLDQPLPQSLSKSWRGKLIWLLPAAMLLWVNLHIGFVFGFLVLGAFWVEELICVLSSRNFSFRGLFSEKYPARFAKAIARRGSRTKLEQDSGHSASDNIAKAEFRNDRLKKLTITGILCVIAALINPNFIKGFLYPLNIFKNYGYLIVENQSIKFLENINFATGQSFLLFKIVCGLVLVSFIIEAFVNWRKVNITILLLTIATGYLAYNGIRHFPSFAFFALVAIASNIGLLIPNVAQATGLLSGKRQAAGLRYKIAKSVFIPIGLFIIIISLSQGYQTLKARADFGLGLLPGANASAEFFKAQNLKGPIFNDYDIGSYLISHLSEQDVGHSPVFVDNRPEAYSVEFFEKVYKPMQEKEGDWKKQDEKYNFNVIFFSHRDYTPWAQAFLIARIQDPAWAPVFVDGYNIIFLRRNEQNTEIIKKYEIPQSRFGISKN